jgi:hypothetical protein
MVAMYVPAKDHTKRWTQFLSCHTGLPNDILRVVTQSRTLRPP